MKAVSWLIAAALCAAAGGCAIDGAAGRVAGAPAGGDVASARDARTELAQTGPARARADAQAHAAADDAEGALPEVALTPQVLFQLLAADIAAQRGENSAAYTTYMSLARETRDPRIARRATEVAIGARALEEAVQAAQLWRELAPSSRVATQTLETLWISTGRLREAEPALEARLARARSDGTLPAAYAQLQRSLALGADRAGAWQLIQRLSKPDLGVAAARLARAAVAAAAAETQAAAAEAREAMRLDPASEDAVVAAAQHLRSLPDGRGQALELLDGFLQRSPAAAEARFAYARLLLADGKVDLARAQFERTLAQNPSSPSVLFALAQIAYQGKQPADAERYLRRYVELPRAVPRDDAAAYLFLAQIAEEDKRLDEALEWLARVPPGDDHVAATVRRAVLIARKGQVQQARDLIAATTGSSVRERARLVAGDAQVLREARRYAEAFDVLSAGLARMPDHPDLLYDHAMAAERVDQVPAMERSLRRLIALRPDQAHAYNALGYTFADRNIRLDEAHELLRKAVELAPDDAHILDSMGWLLYRKKDYAGALGYLRKAYALQPDVEIAAHLGEVLWAMGRHDEARQLWREASGREPDNTVLRETLARLNVAL